MRYYVKLARGTWETVLFIGSKEDADAEADRLNSMYQTDEYYVETYDPAKAWKMPTPREIRKLLKRLK